MDWFSTGVELVSIVAEPLEVSEDEQEVHVLSITEPPLEDAIYSQEFLKSESVEIRQEFGSKERFNLLATGSDSGQPMQFINDKKRKKLRKKKPKRLFYNHKIGEKLVESEKKSFVSRFRKGNTEHIYPVKIASRTILDEQHFDHFFSKNKLIKNNFIEHNDNGSIVNSIKIEEDNEDPDGKQGFVEFCQVKDENGFSSVELEYGSGVSIYESVEVCDSEGESKSKGGSDDSKGFNSSATFKCLKCSVEFSLKSELIKHKKEVHRKQIAGSAKKKSVGFKCLECNAGYKRAFKYHCHMGSHDGRFTCDQCHRTFVRVTGFKKHLRQCHKVANPNICVVCGQYFDTQEKLDEHLQETHPKDAEKLRAYFKQCVHCRYQFITELSYLNHQKNAPYHCRSCNMVFECNNKLGFHLNFKHKPQECNFCGKKFEAFDQYTYHVRYYHTDKSIKCPYCDEHFRVRSRLLIHIDVNHTNGHNYKCNQCQYTAKNYASVNRHRRIMHMPKSETHKNVCNICGKSFLVQSRLKVHMKSHSDDKPHVCAMCGRGYKFEYLLKRHQRNPDLCLRVLFPNGTRYERKGKRRCDMCNLGFPSPDQLALHMVEKHNVKIEAKDTIGTQSTDDQSSTHIYDTDSKSHHNSLLEQHSISPPFVYDSSTATILPETFIYSDKYHDTVKIDKTSGVSIDGGRDLSSTEQTVGSAPQIIEHYVNSESAAVVDTQQLLSVKDCRDSPTMTQQSISTLQPSHW